MCDLKVSIIMSSYLVYYENCAKSLNFFKENKENNDLY